MDSCSVNRSLASNNVDDDASCELRVDDEIEDWVPDSPIKPYVGQIFTSIDAAFSYYRIFTFTYEGKGSYRYSLSVYFQSARDSYRTPTQKPVGHKFKLSRLLLGARESPLSTSEILE
ncbi:hypothetical protein POM88_014140 [Heracleum sosnowskyi]|uniref:Uncharacterized protein n=1 Tax=Heracleum sosnowskyi TaxID=360622 RepID=A0AAD8J1E7_9APIA|nr:hypothetical protein POM88_014140 [Heracleum sosnowskyi]